VVDAPSSCARVSVAEDKPTAASSPTMDVMSAVVEGFTVDAALDIAVLSPLQRSAKDVADESESDVEV